MSTSESYDPIIAQKTDRIVQLLDNQGNKIYPVSAGQTPSVGNVARFCFSIAGLTTDKDVVLTSNGVKYPVSIRNHGGVLMMEGLEYSNVYVVRGTLTLNVSGQLENTRLAFQGVAQTTVFGRAHTHVNNANKYVNIEDQYTPDSSGWVHTRNYAGITSAQMEFTGIRSGRADNMWRIFVTSGAAGAYDTGRYDTELTAKNNQTIPCPYFSDATSTTTNTVWSLEFFSPAPIQP